MSEKASRCHSVRGHANERHKNTYSCIRREVDTMAGDLKKKILDEETESGVMRCCPCRVTAAAAAAAAPSLQTSAVSQGGRISSINLL